MDKKKEVLFGIKCAKYTYAPDYNKQRFSVEIKNSGIFKGQITSDEKEEIAFLIDRGIAMLNAMKSELTTPITH